MNDCVIANKNITSILNQDKLKKITIGNYYSQDRFYSLINEYMDKNISYVSKPIAIIIKYLFNSSNYKHNHNDSKLISRWIFFINLWFLFCILGFVGMLISVVCITGINAKDIINNNLSTNISISTLNAWGEAFINNMNKNIVMLVFATIFLSFTMLWFIVWFFIKRKNKTITLQSYVEKKINFIYSCKYLFNSISTTKSNFYKTINKNEMKIDLIYLENVNLNTNESVQWLNLQLLNLLSGIFVNFNLILGFNNLNELDYYKIKQIIEFDFKNLNILKI